MEAFLGQQLNVPEGSTGLDAGCGVGDVARYLATHFGLKVTGIDLLDFNVDQAKLRSQRDQLKDKVCFDVMDYSELTFPDETFDFVYTLETLVHSDNPETVLEGFFRVLRPGGRLVMIEYSKDPDTAIPSRVLDMLHFVNQVAAMPAFNRFDHGVLVDLVRKRGFSDVATLDITDRMLPMVRCFAIVGALPYAVARTLGKEAKVINAMSGVEFWRHRRYWQHNVVTATKPLAS